MANIQQLNNLFRQTFIGGKVMLTAGVANMSAVDIYNITIQVKMFDNFTPDNDPYNEHDYGSFQYKGDKICWKIDYYDLNLRFLSEDPADETKTNRVLTIMKADEY